MTAAPVLVAPPPPPQRSDLAEARRIAGWISAAQERLPDLVAAVERSGDAAAEIVAYAGRPRRQRTGGER